jgi:two-component system osmolarity sensor histidine kinase EnvZ
MRVLAPRDRAFATQGHIFVLWMTVTTILLTTIAILFIRNQVKAIERLANAAEAFGRGGDVPAFKPQGAKEVRRAASAFLDMRSRIQRHIDQRTTLLASVSHDLRTPLTRLKLSLALAEPSKANAAMKGDLAEMEHMIDEYLAFARGEGGEAVETVHLRELIDEVSEGAIRAGAKVGVAADPEMIVSVRPNALKRALSNLVMNAAVHGERVEVTAKVRPQGRRGDHRRRRRPGHPRGPLRGSLQSVRPSGRSPQPERQGRGSGPRHRSRRRPRAWRRHPPGALAHGRPSRRRAAAGMSNRRHPCARLHLPLA